MKTFAPALILATLIAAAPAFAGPASDMATKRIDAIASGDIQAITDAYTDSATLQWIGGPLDGTYSGPALKDVWIKFLKAQGSLKAGVSNLAESANPKGATVTSNVVFTGKNQIKVRYIQVYREGRLINEVWQIDPTLPG